MLESTVCFHGAVIHFSTNSSMLYNEFKKDFKRYARARVSEQSKVDWNFRIIKTTDVFPIKIPEFAIRDSIFFPSATMHVHSHQLFLEDKERYMIRIDHKENRVEAYFKPSASILEKLRFISKRIILKTLEKKGIFFIHGAGVLKNSTALFFTGSSGAGKTSALLTFINKGYQIITDDTILFQNGEALPFHIRSMIHKETLIKYPEIRNALKNYSTMIPDADGWWIDLGDIYPRCERTIPIEKIFYMYIWNSDETKCVNISQKEMLSKLFKAYFQEMGLLFSSHDSKEESAVFSAYHSLLEHVDCFKVFTGRDKIKFFDALTSTT